MIIESEPIHTSPNFTVYRGRWRDAEVIVKVVLDNLTEEIQNTLMKELDELAHLQHPRIVRLMAKCIDVPRDKDGSIAIITEYCCKGSLHDMLHREQTLSDTLVDNFEEKVRIALEIAAGMKFLHESRVLHRDLKSANILLDNAGHVKIAVFGISKSVSTIETHASCKPAVGTLEWTAPEIIAKNETDYREVSDVYSFGVILWELVTNQKPFISEEEQLLSSIVGTSYEHVPENIQSLLQQCLSPNPSNRPLFPEIVIRLVPEKYLCPILKEIMKDPVICIDGCCYERAAIEEWFRHSNRSPSNNFPLVSRKLVSDSSLKTAIEQFEFITGLRI